MMIPNTKIIRKYLKIALSKNCPNIINPTGDLAKSNDCFTVTVDKNNEPYLLLKELNGNIIKSFEWNGSQYKKEKLIDISDIDYTQLTITHFHKSSIIEFDSIMDFRKQYLTKYIYIKNLFIRLKGSLMSLFYNRKELIIPKRMNLLKIILNKYLEDDSFHFRTISIISLVNSSNKWILHPNHDAHIKEMDMYLDSLVFTNDLTTEDANYHITPKAIVTLNDYEEKDRQYRTQVKLKKWMVAITFAIAFFTLVQIFFHYKGITEKSQSKNTTNFQNNLQYNIENTDSFKN